MTAATGELVRFFSEEGHAKQFVERGILWLSSLEHCRENEDAERRDVTEGHGRLRTIELGIDDGRATGVSAGSGEINHVAEVGNPVYILSCSDASAVDYSLLRERFGRFVVRISDPKQLCLDITEYCQRQLVGCFLQGAVAECHVVHYDKGDLSAAPLGSDEIKRRAYTQKPADFAHDFEHRIVVISGRSELPGEQVPKHMTVDLGRRLTYAEIVLS